MPKTIIPPGTIFGRLMYLQEAPARKERYGLFKCTCGNQKEVRISSVIHGMQRSCGCLKKEVLKGRPKGITPDKILKKEKFSLAQYRPCKATLPTDYPEPDTIDLNNIDWGLIASPLNFSLCELEKAY
jgi:hypothetical protein